MSIETCLKDHADQSQLAVQAFKRDLQKVRTGRATTGLLEGIQVEYYGSKTALTHLGQLSVPEPRMVVVQVYDASAAQAVEKAISQAGLNLNPSREGNVIRVMIPALTQEARKDIVKHLNKMAEEHRVTIRNYRRDANTVLKELEKDGEITKDDAKKATDRIQKQTDQHIAEIDKLFAAKEAEITEG